MSTTDTLDVDCSTRAPAAARVWMRTLLALSLPPGTRDGLVDDALLCATELLSNAVDAGCRSATLCLAIGDSRIRLAILDDADGAPSKGKALTSATSGRGLVIVDALSSRWGVDPAGAGKEVWAELAMF